MRRWFGALALGALTISSAEDVGAEPDAGVDPLPMQVCEKLRAAGVARVCRQGTSSVTFTMALGSEASERGAVVHALDDATFQRYIALIPRDGGLWPIVTSARFRIIVHLGGSTPLAQQRAQAVVDAL